MLADSVNAHRSWGQLRPQLTASNSLWVSQVMVRSWLFELSPREPGWIWKFSRGSSPGTPCKGCLCTTWYPVSSAKRPPLYSPQGNFPIPPATDEPKKTPWCFLCIKGDVISSVCIFLPFLIFPSYCSLLSKHLVPFTYSSTVCVLHGQFCLFPLPCLRDRGLAFEQQSLSICCIPQHTSHPQRSGASSVMH